MAPKYKLTYLNVRGLAEPIRFLLEYGGVDWEDCRIEKGAHLKEIAPFGKVPMLEVDGQKVHQSVAICRYLGKQFKLAGDSDWDALQMDMIVDTIGDMRAQFKELHMLLNHGDGNKDEQAKKKAEFINETVPYYLSRFEAIVKNNGGYFVNGKLSWVDFYWAHMFVTVTGLLGDAAQVIGSKFPLLDALQRKVFELPAVKAWVAKRPQTDH